MIVKDESRSILRCLNSLVDAVDEIVIVDTGSTDNTVNLIKEFNVTHNMNVQVHHFEWIGDFSAARNFSLSKTTYDWKFVIDADEFLHPEDAKNLRDLCKQAAEDGTENIVIDVECINIADNEVIGVYSQGMARLFRGKEIRFERKIHEQLTLTGVAGKRISLPIRLYHDGYDPKLVNKNQKALRNIKLLGSAMQDDPGDFMNHIYYAREIKDFSKEMALQHLLEAEYLYQQTGKANPLVEDFIKLTRSEITNG
ncbi:glycosyltransferase family 2 protein [Paenibacillus sp. sgz500958]|uniref:glycosyltransferase family 2 protein n=1 Tax=Paenibacillus sp. sgz500958 TaxID=3242475 RepID=UPI0036D40DB5